MCKKLLRLRKSSVWENLEWSRATLRHIGRIFLDHRNATVEGWDLASTYVLHPCPRTGCPDFGMDRKGVMGQSVTE